MFLRHLGYPISVRFLGQISVFQNIRFVTGLHCTNLHEGSLLDESAAGDDEFGRPASNGVLDVENLLEVFMLSDVFIDSLSYL